MSVTAQIVPIPARLMLRISEDPNDLRAGVNRQHKLGHDLARELGWTIGVGDIHEDNNRSAWKRNVKRPEFDRLMADMEAGKVRAVIAYDQDRIARRSWQWMYFRDVALEHGVRVAFHTARGEVNLDSPYETGVGSMRAEEESTIKSKRIKDEKQERAEAGRSGNRIKYGWRRVRQFDATGRTATWYDELHPEHAPIVREITHRVLGGQTLARIARDLDARGIPVPTANAAKPALQWMPATVRKLALRPANAGLQEFHGGILDGVVAQAPPIVELGEWERARAILADPARRKITDNRVRHLLSLLARCGVCGGPVRASTKRAAGRKSEWHGYICYDRGCIACRQADADAKVVDTLIRFLDRVDAGDLMDDTSDAAQAAAEVELLTVRLDELAGLLGDGELTARQFREQKAKLDGPLAEARERATTHSIPGRELAYRLAGAEDVRPVWDALLIEQQRALVAALFDVVIVPMVAGGLKSDRVKVTVRAQ